MGTQTEHRPFPDTTPSGEASPNMYHPDLQEALLAGAKKAGADVKRGANVHSLSGKAGTWTVEFVDDSGTHAVGARPDDGVHFSTGFGSFIAPLDNKRARMYVVHVGAMGDRKLSGKNKLPEFFEISRATGASAAWFDGVEVIGPLAEFEGADQCVPAPAKRGLALVGDAAAATEPSWGCDLSKTMVDVNALSTCLADNDDWDATLQRYAAQHDDYYGKLHNILSWMTWCGPQDRRPTRVAPACSRACIRIRRDSPTLPDKGRSDPATNRRAVSSWANPESHA